MGQQLYPLASIAHKQDFGRATVTHIKKPIPKIFQKVSPNLLPIPINDTPPLRLRNHNPQRIRRPPRRLLIPIPPFQKHLLINSLKRPQRRKAPIRHRQKRSRCFPCPVPGFLIRSRLVRFCKLAVVEGSSGRCEWVDRYGFEGCVVCRCEGWGRGREDGGEDALAAGGDCGGGRHRGRFNGDALRPAGDGSCIIVH